MTPAGSLTRQVTEFYRKEQIAGGYEDQRYAGSGGERVSRREMAIATSLLPREGQILDLACGTGRLGRALGSSHELVGLDVSPAMLRQAQSVGRYELVTGDAFSLPFASGSFDGAIALRLAFHFPDPEPLVRELARVTRPGGIVVFETADWSPRTGRAVAGASWGPQIFVHHERQVRGWLDRAGLTPRRRVHAFLLTPVLYRLVAPVGGALLESLEEALPESWRCRTYWQAVVGQR